MKINFKKKPISVIPNNNYISHNSVENELGKGILPQIIDFWTDYEHILFDSGISIYGFNIAVERNLTYEISQHVPEFYLIGDDGSGQGIFLRRDDKRYNIYYLDLGAVGSVPFYSLETNFFKWLENNPEIENGSDDDLVLPMNIIVTKPPTDSLKFIINARKSLNLSLSVAEIKSGLSKLPLLLKENITLAKYGDKVKELNKDYNCLSVVDASNKNRIIIHPS